MDDKILNIRLDSHQAPTPSADLSARILTAASTDGRAANQNQRFAKRFTPIAATLLAVSMVGFTGFNVINSNAIENDKTETALWHEAALDLGFDDIYSWVESEDTPTQ